MGEVMICSCQWVPFKELPCGCEIEICGQCGLKHKKQICSHHRKYTNPEPDLEYYRSLGIFDDNGIPQNLGYIMESLDAWMAIGWSPTEGGDCIEVGAGTGRLIPWMLRLKMRYFAVEPSRWAAEYMRQTYCVQILTGSFEHYSTDLQFKLVMGLHVLEHMADPYAALTKMASLVLPGGHLYIVIPDDEDLGNADHLHYFTPDCLVNAVTAAGLTVIGTHVRRVVEHEQFIYLIAEKP